MRHLACPLLRICFVSLFLLLGLSIFSQQKKIDLQGTWRFDIDAQDKGLTERWYSRMLKDEIVLPGSMTENRKGDEVMPTIIRTKDIQAMCLLIAIN